MPNFKRHRFIAKNDAGHKEIIEEMIKIDADGYFYVALPGHIIDLIPKSSIKRRGKPSAYAKTYEDLTDIVDDALQRYVTPTITTENVILYNIESHVSFAEDEEGNIYPNAGFDGAEWPSHDGRYGNHDASKSAKHGYSLTVGAQAMTKVTTSYGDVNSVKYENYYGDGHTHHDHDHPAALLNQWVCFQLPREPKEMPYSDEAATFFHNLMVAMAALSRQIQGFAFDEKTLLKAIQSNMQPLLPGDES